MNRNSLLTVFVFALTASLAALTSCTKDGGTEENKSISADTGTSQKIGGDTSIKTILFFGNSLTAGYGVEPDQSFPALIQKKIDSSGLKYRVVNAGLSGETTASGKDRVEWVLNQRVDVFVLELGANDGLRGLPLEEIKKNLIGILHTVRERKPGVRIVLAGMQIPPSMGADYTRKFREIFPEVAGKTNVVLIPFLLEGVAGEAKLNLEDGIHPNARGQEIVAGNVWAVLKDVL